MASKIYDSYWEDPEGTNCAKKVWATARMAGILGLIGSSYYVALFTSDNLALSIQKLSGGTLGMAAVGAVFGATTCTAAHLREAPDEPLNYFIGGCAAGAVIGARAHSFAVGTVASISLGISAALVKMGDLEGWRLMGPPRT